jgi:hypothetical protein
MMIWGHINLHGVYDFRKIPSEGDLKVDLQDIKHLEILKILDKNPLNTDSYRRK